MPFNHLDALPAAAWALMASLLICLFLVLTRQWHICHTLDAPGSGPQKLHDIDTPRVGGVAIFLGVIAGVVALSLSMQLPEGSLALSLLVLCSAPVVIFGLLEDITKKVNARWRLAAAFTSAALAWWLCDVRLTQVGLPPFDAILSAHPLIAMTFTLFAVGGITHAMNIIDGLNGLLAGLAIAATAAMAYTAYGIGDIWLFGWAVCLIAAMLGFLVFNFPVAKLFSGDGGAYFIGFCVAVTGVLLVRRNPDVSPWYPLALVIHQVTETLFSTARRWSARRSATSADAHHFHYLVMAKINALRPQVAAVPPKAYQRIANPLASVCCVFMVSVPIAAASMYFQQTGALQWLCLTYVLCYLLLTYWLSRPNSAADLAKSSDPAPVVRTP